MRSMRCCGKDEWCLAGPELASQMQFSNIHTHMPCTYVYICIWTLSFNATVFRAVRKPSRVPGA